MISCAVQDSVSAVGLKENSRKSGNGNHGEEYSVSTSYTPVGGKAKADGNISVHPAMTRVPPTVPQSGCQLPYSAELL